MNRTKLGTSKSPLCFLNASVADSRNFSIPFLMKNISIIFAIKIIAASHQEPYGHS
ncbi:hypothetical protein A35_0065 (plasmid) [Coxiella burnetii 'MSU Goat Q177']|nr:hypothetical protein A35_0065 [Coxiella burnetii 'MSU Goat Q177']